MENKTFEYIYENLALYHFQNNWGEWVGVMIVVGILLTGLYYMIRFATFMVISHQRDQSLKRKKKTLDDLILMKDIQSELEKEIEQAILKAAFHS